MEFENTFRADRRAWEFYQAQALWYRRVSCFWVMSAKREAQNQAAHCESQESG